MLIDVAAVVVASGFTTGIGGIVTTVAAAQGR